MIIKAIEKALDQAKTKNWEKTYWGIDVHDTIIIPNYEKGNIPTQFYPNAIEGLQLISAREDICRILYTCSHPHEIKLYLELFKQHNINFHYVNENPEIKNHGYGNYDKKIYFNVLIDDKSGFDPYEDWSKIIQYLKNTD